MPWREALAWADHNVLPCAGALLDQPYLLWRAMEVVLEGVGNARADRARAERDQMVAAMRNGQ